MATVATFISIMEKNKNKEGVSCVPSGGHSGGHAVAMATASGGKITRHVSPRRAKIRPSLF